VTTDNLTSDFFYQRRQLFSRLYTYTTNGMETRGHENDIDHVV